MSTQNPRPNGGKRKPPKQDGRNARERARVAAAQTARRKKRRNLGIIILAVVVMIAAVGVGIGYATNRGKPHADHDSPSWGPVKIKEGKPITLGEKDAPVTLTLYEDFRCPHCAQMHESLGSTISDLQKSGKIKVELYVLPVIDQQDQQHGSVRAGNAMACAAEEGFGQAYYTGLFDNHGKDWTKAQLLDLAKQVDKPKKKFSSCVNDMKHEDWVDSMSQTAQQNQVESTPTAFINGDKKDDAPEWNPQQLRDAVKKANK